MDEKLNCFIIQPFDRGKYDKRFRDIIEPALLESNCTPYRVDNDNSVSVPIETIEKKIKESDFCLAEISTNNPNVWYELGFAYSADKHVIMISSKNRENSLPFDIRHKLVTFYDSDSQSDFITLKENIINRVRSIKNKIKAKNNKSVQILEQRNLIRPIFSEKLNNSKTRIWVLGTTLNGFREDQKALVRTKLRQGLDIRLLALHPRQSEVTLNKENNSYSLVEWRDWESDSGDKHKKESMKLESWVYKENLKMFQEGNNNRINLKYYISLPIGAIMIVDDILFYSPSLTFSQNIQNSTIFMERGQNSFDKFEEHFKDIWYNSKICFNSTEDQIYFLQENLTLEKQFKRKRYHKALDEYISKNIDLTEHAKDKIYYNELAPFFSLYADKDNEKEVEFIINTEIYSKRSYINILDLGCGVGRHSYHLSKRGFKVTGIDISKSEINLAQKKDDQTEYKVADIRKYRSPRKYDLAICMWSTINYISTDSSLLLFFKNQYKNLKDNGLLLIDLKNPSTIPSQPIKKQLFSFPYSVNLNCNKEIKGKYLEAIYNYKILDITTNERVSILDQELYRIYEEKDIREFSSDYFEIIEIFGSYHINNRFEEDNSNRLILLLRKS